MWFIMYACTELSKWRLILAHPGWTCAGETVFGYSQNSSSDSDEEISDGVDEEFITGERAEPDDNFDHILCMKCQKTEDTTSNSMFICDGDGCQNGLHQNCAMPKITYKKKKEMLKLPCWFCSDCIGTFIKVINPLYSSDAFCNHFGRCYLDIEE